MNFNKSNKLLKKIKNYRDINNENYKNVEQLAKWLFIEIHRQIFNDKIFGRKEQNNDNKTICNSKGG